MTSPQSATFEALREILAKDHELAEASLTPDTALADLNIDSLSLIELIFNLEERFGVEAHDVPAELPTLGDVAALIDRLIAARDAAPAATTAD